MNSNNRRRNFRSRPQKNSFRRRGSSLNSNSSNNLNGNLNFSRNGSMNNIHNVEKTMQKYQQLAKDAQSNGDPVLAQNYLQHADHYLRRFNELSERNKEVTINKPNVSNKSVNEDQKRDQNPRTAQHATPHPPVRRTQTRLRPCRRSHRPRQINISTICESAGKLTRHGIGVLSIGKP